MLFNLSVEESPPTRCNSEVLVFVSGANSFPLRCLYSQTTPFFIHFTTTESLAFPLEVCQITLKII